MLKRKTVLRAFSIAIISLVIISMFATGVSL